jgi:hypothetical protein
MRNEITLASLARELERNCGDTLAAAKAVGVSLVFVNQWRKDDKIVDERLAEAERVGTQGLVSAAIQRGVIGVTRDIYYKGVVVGHETEYSDSLLNTLLKAKVDDFKKDSDGPATVNVNIANIMPRAASYEQWLQMKQQTLAKPAEALPAPDANRDASLEALGRVMCEPSTVIEAEYEEIPQHAFAGIEL